MFALCTNPPEEADVSGEITSVENVVCDDSLGVIILAEGTMLLATVVLSLSERESASD